MKKKNLQKRKFLYDTSNLGSELYPKPFLYNLILVIMAKGKSTFQIGKSQSGLSWYIYPVNKKNLPQGEKLKLKKYDKKLRKHVEFTFKDVK
jgi:ribosomal protein L33